MTTATKTLTPQPSTPPRTVLVVEDEVLVRLVIADYLRECGYRVHEAANSAEAIEVLQSPDVSVDIVFSDVLMPGEMDGFGLSTWIRSHRPDLDDILAGSIPRSVNAAAELCGAQTLAKPYQAQTLLDEIKQLVAARRTRGGG